MQSMQLEHYQAYLRRQHARPCSCSVQQQRQRLVHSRSAACRVSSSSSSSSSSVFDASTDYRALQQQGGPSYARPDWHPLLFRTQPGSKSYQASVRSFYEDVWNNGCVELLGELAARGVVYSDALGFVEDAFGISGLQDVIQQFQATHPICRFTVEDIVVDEEHSTVAAFYTATAAHLLPSHEGVPATGHVSTVQGMDRFQFDRHGRCTSIQSYRQRFMDEELQLIDWDIA